LDRRAAFLRKATLVLGIPLSLWFTYGFYELYHIRNFWAYVLLIAWTIGGSYAAGWVFWVLLEKPRLDEEDRRRRARAVTR
jgi:hypothetical protein